MKTAEETEVLAPAADESPQQSRPIEQVRCSSCGQGMAPDQRYCLQCGSRRGGPRVEFDGYLGERAEAEKPGLFGGEPPPPTRPAYWVSGAEPDPRPVREVTPLMAAAGLMAFALILIFGVLIGKQGNGGGGMQTPIVAATGMPAAAPGSTSTTTDVNVSFQADWPAGKEGFTIELATLSKEGTDPAMVESTKVELSGQGASAVGVLDSDEFGSLPGGNYVFYSGEYTSRAEARSALASLEASFPDAQVIEVAAEASTPAAGDGAGNGDGSLLQEEAGGEDEAAVEASKATLEDINSGSAEEFQESMKKLPSTIETEGKAPPKDNKPAGGGSGDAVEIG